MATSELKGTGAGDTGIQGTLPPSRTLTADANTASRPSTHTQNSTQIPSATHSSTSPKSTTPHSHRDTRAGDSSGKSTCRPPRTNRVALYERVLDLNQMWSSAFTGAAV
ncbi:hypothetical protein M405DRAFT_930854 [Rhizopogon salebrosus TDB-379]|nr:hypothetical protein M405DRAFT_930854 [Rhizopogon salebrosus TDB-379]